MQFEFLYEGQSEPEEELNVVLGVEGLVEELHSGVVLEFEQFEVHLEQARLI